MGILTQAIEYEGPQSFSPQQLRAEKNLFAERSALFYTPTENIPSKWVGEGPLDVMLPLATPSFCEVREIRWYETPRLWVDLLQRATGKLRWRPFRFARLTIVRYDSVTLSVSNGFAGGKALIDALKVRTTGRSDGRLLYYFGAILDDSTTYIAALNYKQKRVRRPSAARTRIIVQSA